MELSIVEIVTENNMVCSDPEQWAVFLPVILKEAGAGNEVVVLEEDLFGQLESSFPFHEKIVVGESCSGKDTVTAGSWLEALAMAEGKKVVAIPGKGAFREELYEKAECLYLLKRHLEGTGGFCLAEVDPAKWIEAERRLYPTGEGEHRYSLIRYGRTNSDRNISVILSTYNQPLWLERVLWGYECQSFKNFEVIIADDGSKQETSEMIEQLRPRLSYPLKHVWHEDNGFQKCVILNKAIAASSTDYLLFSDGDCVPRYDFLEIHMKYRKPGYFLSGGYHKLPMETSLVVTNEDICNGNCFDVKWLKAHGMKPSFKNNKLTSHGFKEWVLNTFTPTKATWNGHNASGWKKDILATNGFDERMEYGGEDREMGERLMNAGIRTRQIRYSAITIHLDHKRGYVRQEALDKNKAIRRETAARKIKRTEYGILKSRL